MTESRRVAPILEAARLNDISRALELSNALLSECEDCPYLLVLHSILIRMEDGETIWHSLEDAEHALLRAHSLDRSYLPAIEELAHYYDAVSPNRVKARAFAAEYIEKS